MIKNELIAARHETTGHSRWKQLMAGLGVTVITGITAGCAIVPYGPGYPPVNSRGYSDYYENLDYTPESVVVLPDSIYIRDRYYRWHRRSRVVGMEIRIGGFYDPYFGLIPYFAGAVVLVDEFHRPRTVVYRQPVNIVYNNQRIVIPQNRTYGVHHDGPHGWLMRSGGPAHVAPTAPPSASSPPARKAAPPARRSFDGNKDVTRRSTGSPPPVIRGRTPQHYERGNRPAAQQPARQQQHKRHKRSGRNLNNQ